MNTNIRRAQPADAGRATRRRFRLAVAIVAVTLLAYLPVMLRGGFFWDDDSFLYANKLIRAPDGLRRLWFTKEPTDYFPLTSSVLWVEWRVWGNDPRGYHVVNVLLHAAAAVLAWRVLVRLRVPGAWLAGLLFAVHPAAAASVAWITELKNTLPMALYLMSLLAWLRFDDGGFHHDETTSTTYGTPHYLLSLGLFLLALLAKTSVVMLPAVLLLCAWWRRGRISLRDLARSLPFFALSLALGCVTVWFQLHKAIAVGEIVRPEGFFSRVAAAGWIAWFYLCKVLLPAGLCVIYPRWDVSGSSVLAFLPLALLIAGLAWLWTRRKSWGRAPLFAAAYFLVSLLPVLGFVDTSFMENSLVADHLQYVAMIGVIAFAAGMLARLAGAKGAGAPMGLLAAAGCVLVLGSLTWTRAALYGDARNMWRDNVTKNPSAWLAWNNLGWTCHSAGDDEEAVEDFSRAIALKPNFAQALSNRGGVYAILGKLDLAMDDCNRAVALLPKVARVRINRGNIFFQTHRLSEAIADYDEAIRLNPNFADAYANRARAWLELKEYDKAWADVKMFRSLGGATDPDFVPSLIEASGRSE
ncbi:MAG: tetratricopeptide repeat protein [Candidatus Brocadiia bacterium]|jgi:tetratricopeptide (TPR) repeat protein